MADEEKKVSEDKTPGLIAEILGIVVIVYFLLRLLGVFGGNTAFLNSTSTFFSGIFGSAVATGLIIFLIVLSNAISIIFVAGIVYALINIREIEILRKKTITLPPIADGEQSVETTKWQQVLNHVGSENPSDWRLAILEVDIMLDDLLDKLGIVGDTMGDKLKKINKADFKTLDAAWEGHKIRNAIAHEGQDFTITKREAQRVIALYEAVFKEFNFV